MNLFQIFPIGWLATCFCANDVANVWSLWPLSALIYFMFFLVRQVHKSILQWDRWRLCEYLLHPQNHFTLRVFRWFWVRKTDKIAKKYLCEFGELLFLAKSHKFLIIFSTVSSYSWNQRTPKISDSFWILKTLMSVSWWKASITTLLWPKELMRHQRYFRACRRSVLTK